MISCPVCSASDALPLWKIRAVPLVSCQVLRSAAEARSIERGDLDLVACGDCGHVYNRGFEPERTRYAPGYENALGFSPRHRSEMDTISDRLIGDYGLHDKSVLEIGCGAGDFLSMICCKGPNRGIGYDPTQQTREQSAGRGMMTVRGEVFRGTAANPVDFVCARHVLEHLPDVADTLEMARACLKSTGRGYFQVPNGQAIFRRLSIWDLTYEHVSYFSATSLQRALWATGFAVLRLTESFGGQYLDADVAAAANAPNRAEHSSTEIWHAFPEAFEHMTGIWRRKLWRLLEESRRTIVWGAGSKAVTFLNLLDVQSGAGIDFAVDVNPRKAGRYIPGSAQQIVPPEFLRHYRPDTVIVMNGEYLPEIRGMLAALQVDSRLVVATPGRAHA